MLEVPFFPEQEILMVWAWVRGPRGELRFPFVLDTGAVAHVHIIVPNLVIELPRADLLVEI